jgi:5,10-methylenetetrahydromethanopterin reductase
VQAESAGRAVLGIGRGDSSLAHLGRAPAPVPVFERYVGQLQAYLRGDEVPLDQLDGGRDAGPSADTLELAGSPTASSLRWLPPDLAKVPVDVMASGPKVIEGAARLADRVTFAVGSDPGRLRALDTALAARTSVGRAFSDNELGVFLPIVVHDDRATARQLISSAVASYARF